ncbi:hypothetical protein NE686_19795 [Tissierella carlieri]|uniref:Uncharacterized protein n=1 Tax=Tissierella carlieri TaxID=689904 RepID=A0ABT1SG70_9FIRM|nr:hypothetical protein [Tissierella carlieri]MCQ4925357.1 hypothetical protein [Tissierella carlieri]
MQKDYGLLNEEEIMEMANKEISEMEVEQVASAWAAAIPASAAAGAGAK